MFCSFPYGYAAGAYVVDITKAEKEMDCCETLVTLVVFLKECDRKRCEEEERGQKFNMSYLCDRIVCIDSGRQIMR